MYSVRCTAGQVFDFDESQCRPVNLVDCPLQLQRFQAPAIPFYLRPNTPQENPQVRIQVLQSPGSNGLTFFSNGRQVQTATAQAAQPRQASVTSSIHQNPLNQDGTPRRQLGQGQVVVEGQGLNPLRSQQGFTQDHNNVPVIQTVGNSNGNNNNNNNLPGFFQRQTAATSFIQQ